MFMVDFFNGEHFEDAWHHNLYYSSYKLARAAFDNYEATYPQNNCYNENADLCIFEVVLDTQEKTLVYRRRAFVGTSMTDGLYDEEPSAPSVESTPRFILPDIDALAALRDKLASI